MSLLKNIDDINVIEHRINKPLIIQRWFSNVWSGDHQKLELGGSRMLLEDGS